MFKWIFISAFTSVLMLLLWLNYRSKKKLFETGRVTQATIKEVRKSRHGGVYYNIDFKDPMGVVISAALISSAGSISGALIGGSLDPEKAPYKVGDVIEIIYDKDNPLRVAFNDPAILHTIKKQAIANSLIIGAVFAVTVLLALASLFFKPQ